MDVLYRTFKAFVEQFFRFCFSWPAKTVINIKYQIFWDAAVIIISFL